MLSDTTKKATTKSTEFRRVNSHELDRNCHDYRDAHTYVFGLEK
ncbi:hypothetical protein OSCI_3080014 [Kamptonema sp. PCC 6506]|nr:hypothetical protein OSCI_3080014 [Kamptonema sp. PCC 6506]